MVYSILWVIGVPIVAGYGRPDTTDRDWSLMRFAGPKDLSKQPMLVEIPKLKQC